MEEKEVIRSPRSQPTRGLSNKPAGVMSHSVLSQRHYKKVCFIGAVVFLMSFLAIGIHHLSTKDGICNYNVHISQWAREFNIASAGALVVAIVMQVNRINLSTFREDNDIGTLSTYYASIVVNTISATSHLGAILFQWGGICRDAFGVYSPAVVWPEWAVSVPLLIFITVSVDDRPSLCREDILTIISLHLSIILASLMLVVTDTGIAFLLVLLSCVLCSPCVLLVWRTSRELESLLKKSMESESKRGLYQRRILLASRKATLSACLGYLLPIFPMIYFLRVSNIIDDNLFFVGIMFASAFTKVTFASLCMDAHLEVSHPAIALIDAENFANTSRRAFLRFVFHEVRVPLNSISMGVQVLESSDKIVEEDRDTVTMVKEAVTFMGETLNDVMALQKVEEGSLELIYKSFSVVDLFQNVEDSFIDTSVEYGVVLSTDIDPRIPARIIGDKFRIRHVLANLVSNALKYSYSGGHVQLRAYLDPEADTSEYGSLPVHGSSNFVTVVFSVIDEGKGISEEDQEEDIFQPYRLLKHGELKHGRGTGLGLAICKEIVRMHSGQIWYTSKLGNGSTFYVSLPLEISLDNKQRTSGTWYRQQRHRGSSRRSLTTKMMSHWNVMMATGSQADMTHSVTPSPGLQSRNFSSSSPYGEMRRQISSSSSEGNILIDSSLEDSDLFELRKVSDRAVRALSIESQSKDEASSKNHHKPSNKKDEESNFARTHSTKSIELTESDIVNLHAYEEDGEDEIFPDSERNNKLRQENEATQTRESGTESKYQKEEDHGHTKEDEKLSISVPTTGEENTLSCSTTLTGTAPSSISHRQPRLSPDYSSPSLKIEKSIVFVEKPLGEIEKANGLTKLASSSTSKHSEKIHFSPGHHETASTVNSASKSPFARFPKTFLGDPGTNDSSPQSGRYMKKSSPSPHAHIPKPSRPHFNFIPEDGTSNVPPSSSNQALPSSALHLLEHTKNTPMSPHDGKSTILHTMSHQGVASISTPPSSPFNHRYSYYNVLIVDDVTSNRKLLALLLNKRGIHSITFAEDGAAGVEMVREKGIDSFDLIFMDNTMPRMTGIEATIAIRKLGHDNLIIGVTGNSMEDELGDFIVAGADLVITKPMKPHVLDILLQFVSTFGCRSHPNQRLVIRNTSLEWVNTDSSGHTVSKGYGSSFL